MISKLFALLAIAAGLSSVQAQAFTCEGFEQPNYETCDQIVALVDWDSNVYDIPDGQCAEYAGVEVEGKANNCILHVCNTRGDGQATALNVVSGETRYGLIKDNCKAQLAGGRAPGPATIDQGGDDYIMITHNPNANGKRRRAASRALRRAPVGNGVSRELKTFAELEARLESSKQQGFATSALEKRQASWTTFTEYKSIRRDGFQDQMSGRIDPGASQTYSTTEGYSTSISVSTEAGFNFEVFSASISIEVTSTYSKEHTHSYTFDPANACEPGQQGILYFVPLWNHYVGAWSDNPGQTIDVWVPLDSTQPDYNVECLG